MLLAVLKLDHHSVGHGVCKGIISSLTLLLVVLLFVKSEAFLNALKLVLKLQTQV